MLTVWPNVWNSGRQPSTTSSARASLASKTLTVAFMHQVQVGQHGALGLAGGARGVEDDGRVVRLAGDVGVERCDLGGPLVEPGRRVQPSPPITASSWHACLLGRRRALCEQRCRGDQHFRPESRQHVADLPGHQQGVHRHDDAAERQDGVSRPAGSPGTLGIRMATGSPGLMPASCRTAAYLPGLAPTTAGIGDALRPDHHRVGDPGSDCRGFGEDGGQEVHGTCAGGRGLRVRAPGPLRQCHSCIQRFGPR